MNDPALDPLDAANFKQQKLIEKLLSTIFGLKKPLDCVQIEVSSHCMGKCVYCPHTTFADSWTPHFMEAATFAKLWPLLRNTQRAHLQGWGEPLLHPRFFDFVKFAAKAGAQVSTTTCGLVMNEEIRQKIVNSGMDVIAFSLVGTDPASNDARRNVPFDTVCANIKFLREGIRQQKKGPEIHLAYLLLADRMEAALELPRLMEELDIDMTVVSTLDYISLPQHKKLAILPTETEKITGARTILDHASAEIEKMDRFIHFALPKKDAIQECGCRENIVKSLYVDAFGALSPCVYLNVPGATGAQSLSFGNVRDTEALEIWHNPAWQNFRKAIVTPNPHPLCLDCPKRNEG